MQKALPEIPTGLSYLAFKCDRQSIQLPMLGS
jgi:hypothetical protein